MPQEQLIEVGDLTTSVFVAGAGGDPLLLIHGFTSNRTDFADVVDPLAALGWHVVAPDLRGHGTSPRPPADDESRYSFEAFATDALAPADELRWDTFVLLGHSMGGVVAQHLVLAAPERIRGLILMDTTANAVDIDPDIVRAGAELARTDGVAAIVEVLRLVDDPLGTPANDRLCATAPGYAERGEVNTLQCSAAMYASMLTQLVEPQDRLPALAGVGCPTLVLVGEQDAPFIRASEALTATIPGATLTVIPDVGHSPQFENTDAWLAAVTTFLMSLD